MHGVWRGHEQSKVEECDQGILEERVAARSSALRDGTPSRVLIMPWGQVESSHGRFVMDEAAGCAVMEAFAVHGTDLPIDYEHQSLGGTYASPTGQAPAAGWIRGLHLQPERQEDQEPGLYADVEWTGAARERLSAREYRYISPVVFVRKSDRRVVALHSAALTNKPAIVGMRPIVNRADAGEGEGQGATSGAAEGARPGEPQPSEPPVDGVSGVELLRLRLGLSTDVEMESVLAAAERRIGELTAESRRRDAEEKVQEALCAGKLACGQRAWALSLAMKDPAGFESWAASAPVVVAIGRTEPPLCGQDRGSGARRTVVAAARVAFQAQPALALLTSEQAWIAQALREAGLDETAGA
ncbi:MAG: hypothetical protein AMXMBFR13_40000 [Phycisphaerae bacterium]